MLFSSILSQYALDTNLFKERAKQDSQNVTQASHYTILSLQRPAMAPDYADVVTTS